MRDSALNGNVPVQVGRLGTEQGSTDVVFTTAGVSTIPDLLANQQPSAMAARNAAPPMLWIRGQKLFR